MSFTAQQIQSFKKIETPFYYYDLRVLRATLEIVQQYSKQYEYVVHYALKANANLRILHLIEKYGLGADCVSGNEVLRAVEAGFSPSHIAFAGVGKTDKEILTGLRHHIFSFNCESVQELEVINELAAQINTKARIALRLNPNVEADTHHYITTGLHENKFGISLQDLPAILDKMAQLKNLELTGIHFHIGSQITNLDNFKKLCLKINEIVKFFDEKQIKLTHINVGGGLGIDYLQPNVNPIADFANYFGVFHQYLQRRPHQAIHFELGRAIVAQCGSLISKVLFVKEGQQKKFAIIDAGMTELIRPALYQAHHEIEALTPEATTATVYDIVGPICESSDCFGTDRKLPTLQRGDLVAIRSAGAYGEVMASQYNLREKVRVLYNE